jgi:hypothetical protein
VTEVSLHHGVPVGAAGDVVNELGYDGYARQPYQEVVTFPAIPPHEREDVAPPAYWAITADGTVLAYDRLPTSPPHDAPILVKVPV